MAVTTTSYQVHPFPLGEPDRPLPPPPAVAITPADPWPRPYYLEGGLRRVAPYHFTYNTYCKQRWRGRELLDIFATEFRDRSRDYYETAIKSGQIVVNGKPCHDVRQIINNGDVISHTLHRHEPPVTAQPIRIISETDAMIVIDKPAGVPVHPAGRYNYNSVVEIMRAERHMSFEPRPCNRLDRLTSGVMFVGKTSQEAEVISEQLRGRTVRKEYVARVKGRFPDGEDWDGDEMRGGVVKCEESILQISPILGLNRARASGKSAKTLFRRIAYYAPQPTEPASSPSPHSAAAQPAPPNPGTESEGYSIVHCLPLTGRTHQIRVHLQFLGHPISNDPIYSNRRVFGASLAQNDSSPDHDAAIIERLSKMGKTEVGGADPSLDSDSTAGPNGTTTTPTSQAVNSDQSTLIAPLIEQTRQMTVSEAAAHDLAHTQARARAAREAAESSPSIALNDTPFKPLNAGTLHAGSISPSPSTPTSTATTHLPTGTNPSTANPDAEYAALLAAHDAMVTDYNARKGEKLTGQICPVCATPLYSDPGPHELGIYLHALAYTDLRGGKGEAQWGFRSAVPAWALPPAGRDGPREIPSWVDGGRGWEVLAIGDEGEDGRRKNREGEGRNKESLPNGDRVK